MNRKSIIMTRRKVIAAIISIPVSGLFCIYTFAGFRWCAMLATFSDRPHVQKWYALYAWCFLAGSILSAAIVLWQLWSLLRLMITGNHPQTPDIERSDD